MSTPETTVKVRAQAVGGKFLGKGVDETPAPTVTVNDPAGHTVATATFMTGNSGTISPSSGDPNTLPICVAANDANEHYKPGTYYLSPVTMPENEDSFAPVMLPLTDSPVAYTFIVQAYNSDLPGPGSATVITHTALVDNSTQEVVVPIPGLRITNVAASGGEVKASVAMMCGCMITPNDWDPPQGSEPYWPAYEFQLQASAQGDGVTRDALFFCTGPSQFTTQGFGLQAGQSYEVTIYASQNAMGQPCTDVAGNVNKVQTMVTAS